MGRKYAVGIDVGLNEINCVLVREDGSIAAHAVRPYETRRQEIGWSEQDPSHWWDAAREALSEITESVTPANIAVAGLSGQLYCLVPLDENDDVIRNAILMNDERNAAEYNAVLQEETASEAGPRSFCPHFVAGMLRWLKKNEPENYSRIASLVMAKDYVRLMLTGSKTASASDAEHSGFFQTDTNKWDMEVLSEAGYAAEAFPGIIPAGVPCGTVTEKAARQTGLPPGIPVYADSEDVVLEYAAARVLCEGCLGVVLGSSGAVMVIAADDARDVQEPLRIVPDADCAKSILYGREASCMDSVDWMRDALFGYEEDPAAACRTAASRAPVGSHGIVFLPCLMGQGAQHKDSDARAVFYGLSGMTKAHDLARSVMEGVVYGLRDLYDLMKTLEPEAAQCSRIMLTGEGAREDVMCQIVADVFGMPVHVYGDQMKWTAYCAALSADAAERILNPCALAELGGSEKIFEPDQANSEHYEECIAVYRELAADLKRK